MDYAQKAINELLQQFTQDELAELLNEKQPNISAYKNGSRSVSKKVRTILAEKFGYDYKELQIQKLDIRNKTMGFDPDEKGYISNKEFLSHIPEPEKKFNPTVKDVNKAIKEAKLKKEQKENAKVNEKLPIIKEVKVIPEKVALGLVSSFFDNEYVNALETELVQVEEYFSEDAYKVDTVGESMNDGTLRSLLDGDKYLAKDIPRSKWGEKLINGGKNLFYILHAERGHLIKEIIEHNIEDKTITLHSYNPNKKLFPDFTIKTTECYIIASIQELLSRKI